MLECNSKLAQGQKAVNPVVEIQQCLLSIFPTRGNQLNFHYRANPVTILAETAGNNRPKPIGGSALNAI